MELTDQARWFYVRTNTNPADLLSRGLLQAQKLQDNLLWWHGPQYLADREYVHKDSDSGSKIELPTDLQIKNEQNLVSNITKIDPMFTSELFKKYSSIHKLQRIIGYIYRFFNNCSNNNNKVTDSSLTPQEMRDSMAVIVRSAQREYFHKEIELLSTGKTVKSGIGNLHPFLEQQLVLREGGRLHNADDILYDKKHPAILPKKCRVTDLIIESEHLRLLHAGPRMVLSSLSQRYSIISGIREVKKVIHKCVNCRRLKAATAKQLMGYLPRERITASRPFQHVGVDFCGPFEIKVARVRRPIVKKAYIALFVCFAIKAIHVELVSDLTTEAFLACLKRFISRRGMPTKVFCDNAKTFRELRMY